MAGEEVSSCEISIDLHLEPGINSATSPPSDYRLHQNSSGVAWAVETMWQREAPNPEPHVACILVNKAPLHNDRISVPEMRAILTLSGFRSVDKGYCHHKVIPVSHD